MKLTKPMALALVLTFASMGFAQGLATDAGKGAKDVGKAVETGSKDAARGTEGVAKDTAHATDKAADDTAREPKKAAPKNRTRYQAPRT